LGKDASLKHFWIDLETTGLDPRKNGVVQISALIELEGEVVESIDYHVRPIPGDGVTSRALEVNRLSIEEIKEFPPAKEIFDKLITTLNKYVDPYNKQDKFTFIGYNARFDYDFLRKWMEKLDYMWFGSYFWFPPIDIMNLAAFFMRERRHKIFNFKLETISALHGLKPTEGLLHNAAFDIELTRDLYQELIKKANVVNGLKD